MPIVYDDLPKKNRIVYDDENSSPDQQDDKGLRQQYADGARNVVNAIDTGLASGVGRLQGAVGTFIQAPLANTVAGVKGAGALAERGITGLANLFGADAQVNQSLIDDAAAASQEAMVARERNTTNPANLIARFGLSQQKDSERLAKDIRAQEERDNPELVRQRKAMGEAEGFVDNLKAIPENPLAFINTLASSAPDMALGVGAGMALKRAGASATAIGAAGSATEAATGALQARQGVYESVMNIPEEKLSTSPLYNSILQETGDKARAREVLANQLADQAPILSGAGTALGGFLVNRLFGGDATTKAIVGGQKLPGIEYVKRAGQESLEEAAQGIPEDAVRFGTESQADPSKKYDIGGSLAQNLAAGLAMGGIGQGAAYARDSYLAEAQARSANPTAPNEQTPTAAKPSTPTALPPSTTQATRQPQGSVPISEPGRESVPSNDDVASELVSVNRQLAEVTPENGYGPSFDGMREELQARREELVGQAQSDPSNSTQAIESPIQAAPQASIAAIEQPTATAATSTATAVTPEASDLQNRDRSRVSSVAQMQQIAAAPDYQRLSISRSPESGAPMAFAVGDDFLNVPQGSMGNGDTAVMSDGQRVPFRYAVVEADTVQPSNFADGRANPDYNSGVNGTIKALNNGRTAGVRAAYDRGSAGQYRSSLEQDAINLGIDPQQVSRLRNPMLVRLYSDADNTANMGARSQGAALGMSTSELATQDAPLIDSTMLSDYQGGDIGAATNRDFVRGFVGKLAGAGQDTSTLMTATGELSQDGRKRVSAALMQAAYGDSKLIDELYESLDTDIKGIGEALKSAAGSWALMRQAVSAGAIPAEFDVTGNLLQAVEMIKTARSKGTSLYDATRQVDMLIGDTVSLMTVNFLRVMYSGQYFTQATGKDKVADAIRKFAKTAVSAASQENLFGEPVTPQELFNNIIGKEATNEQTATQNTTEQPAGSNATGGRDGRAGQTESQPAGQTGGNQPDGAGQGQSGVAQGANSQSATEAGQGNEEKRVGVTKPKEGVFNPSDVYLALSDAMMRGTKSITDTELREALVKAEMADSRTITKQGEAFFSELGNSNIGQKLTTAQAQVIINNRLGKRAPGPESSDDFTLKAQTEEDAKKAQAEQDAREKKKRDDEAKARADERVGDFKLTGSDRDIDIAEANGQQGLFDGNTASAPSKSYTQVDPDSDENAPQWAGKNDTVYDDPQSKLTTGLKYLGKNPDGAEVLEGSGYRLVRENGYSVISSVPPRGIESFNAEFKTKEEISEQTQALKKGSNGNGESEKTGPRQWSPISTFRASIAMRDPKLAAVGTPQDGVSGLTTVKRNGTFTIESSGNQVRVTGKFDDGAAFPEQTVEYKNNVTEPRKSDAVSFVRSRVGLAEAPMTDAQASAEKARAEKLLADRAKKAKPAKIKEKSGVDAELVADLSGSIKKRQGELDTLTAQPGFDEAKAVRLSQLLSDLRELKDAAQKGTEAYNEVLAMQKARVSGGKATDKKGGIGQAIAGAQTIQDGRTLAQVNPEKYENSLTDFVDNKIEQSKAEQSLADLERQHEEAVDQLSSQGAIQDANLRRRAESLLAQIEEIKNPGIFKAVGGVPAYAKAARMAVEFTVKPTPIEQEVRRALKNRGIIEPYLSDMTDRVVASVEGKKSDVKPAAYGADNKLVSQDRAEELRKKLKAKLGKLNSGIDPEMLAMGAELAAFHIEAGARKFADFASAISADLDAPLDKLRQYLRSWYNGARDMMEDSGQSVDGMDSPEQVKNELNQLFGEKNVRTPSVNSESDRPDPNEGAVDEGAVSGVTGRAGQDTGLPGEGAGGARGGLNGGIRLPDGSSPVGGERSNNPVHTKAGEARLAEPTTGSDLFGGSNESGGNGQAPVARTGGTTAVSADKADGFAEKLKQQKKAESIPVVVADKANIDETLPFLNEGQREDVAFAERRLSKPDGYGVLFTNGTGTGKTYLGLGTVKRFSKQGKNNIIIVVPNEAVINEWVKSAPSLGLNMTQLPDTSSAGKGIVITTYANFGSNDSLGNRKWDLVVMDEAHYLMTNKDAEDTKALEALRAISYHPEGWAKLASMRNPTIEPRLQSLIDSITGNSRLINNPDTMVEMADALRQENQKLEKEFVDLDAKWKKIKEQVGQEVKDAQGAERTRAMFLSATPFAYEKNVQWAENYLFNYPAVPSGGYNTGSPFDKFMMTKFGYRMRYNKLTQPGTEVDTSLMQRTFNTDLRKSGALSARMLDVDADYERKFILVRSGIGQQIDEGLEWLRESENGRYFGLFSRIMDKFDYLSRMRLLEAIKAQEAVQYIKQHHAMGRKVVVFYDFNQGGGINVFDMRQELKDLMEIAPERRGELSVEVPVRGQDTGGKQTEKVFVGDLMREFLDARADLVKLNFSGMRSPLEVLLKEFPNAGVYNGEARFKKTRVQAIENFRSDENPQANLILVQKNANAGWSGHDTTGKHQRVLINLGLPTAPIVAIQQEGRIYRVGQVSDANFHYFNTGTNWERTAFATTIARRASTAENLAMGEQARGLRDAFIEAFEASDGEYTPSGGDGKGGKAKDRAFASALTDFDRAKAMYFGEQKRNSKTKAKEGVDYFATPEPVGVKMVEFANVQPRDSLLEPSAGHGAIARWFPEFNNRTVIEPSYELASRLQLATDAKAINERFEDHNRINKYDVIVMNPPFGSGGSNAIAHLKKAATEHLNDGGRVVAIIPTGPAADKKFEKFLYGTETVSLKPIAKIDNKDVFVGDTVSIKFDDGVWVVKRRVPQVGAGNEGRVILELASPGKNGKADEKVSVPIESVLSVNSTGARTKEVSQGDGLYLSADIKLPTVTFERAGTSVATRIVVLDKVADSKSATGIRTVQRDLTDIEDINELFDRMSDMSIPGRVSSAQSQAPDSTKASKGDAKAAALAAENKAIESGAIAKSDADVFYQSSGDKILTNAPMVEFTTQKGKVLQGVLVGDKALAKSVDSFAFVSRQFNGKYFVRLQHVQRPTAGDEKPAFSRGNSSGGMPVDALQVMANRTVKNWANKPTVKVLSGLGDPDISPALRAGIEQAEREAAASGSVVGAPQGVYFRGTVYLFADQIRTPQEAYTVLLHESIGHYGLRSVFGRELDKILEQIVATRRKDVANKASSYGLDMNDANDRLTAAEEVLAEMAQTDPQLGFVKRAIAAIRTWLRQNVPGFKDLALSDSEIIRNYLMPARDWVRRGQQQQTKPSRVGTPVFSRSSDQTLTAAFKAWFGDWEAAKRQKEIDQFIEYAINTQDPTGEMVLRPTSQREIDEVFEKSGLDISGMSHVLVAHELKHASKHFADDEAKRFPSQRAMTLDDLKRIPATLDGYDSLTVQKRGANRSSLIYRKQFSDGRIEYVERVIETSQKNKPRLVTKTVWVVAPIGVESNPPQVSTPERKDSLLFRDGRVNPELVSKVVDAEGRPLVMYHGTPYTFVSGGESAAFETKQFGALLGKGAYFTVNPSEAAEYAGKSQYGKPNIIPAYISLKNPYIVTSSLAKVPSRTELEAQGFDGVLLKEKGAVRWAVAFEPAQIKSVTGNNGAFDPANPDIRFSRSAKTSQSANMDRGLEAMQKALREKNTVHRAMYRSEIGWIDFVWGSEGKVKSNGRTKGAMGLAHLIEARIRKDQLSKGQAFDVARELVRVIAFGKMVIAPKVEKSTTATIEFDRYFVSLAKLDGGNAFVVTGFELRPDAGGKGYDNPASTQLRPTLSRPELGAGLPATDAVLPSLDEAMRRDSTERGSPTGAASNSNIDPNEPPVKFMRQQSEKTPQQKAEEIIQTPAATAKPIDRLAKYLSDGFGVSLLASKIFDFGAYLFDTYTPDKVKAGLVSDYGVPEAVIDRRTLMAAGQRVQLRKTGSLLEKLSTLTREESRIVYEMMNERDPALIQEMAEQLPPESLSVIKEVQDMIERLSQSAMDLKQLTPEAYERNKFAYLHRSYQKYELGQTKLESLARRRSIAILGEQYKGRGIVESEPMRKLQAAAPDWWKRKLVGGKADTSLKGERFIRLERRKANGAGVDNLDGIEGRKPTGKLLEVQYWPAGEAIPSQYAEWDQAGVFDVRDTKGADVILWRDYSKTERQAMGEIDEARFAIAKTLHQMVRDIEVGRYLEWVSQSYSKPAGAVVNGKPLVGSERLKDVYSADEWVLVPESKIDGTQVAKYGKLAGRYVPGPIWNDIRQIVNGQFKPFGDTYAKILSLWKTSKTALSPAVHMNNVMSNVVMSDWHDVTAGHVNKALKVLLKAQKDPASQEIINRYLDSGGDLGSWATNELAKEQIEPLLAALELDLSIGAGASQTAQIGVMSALQAIITGKMPAAAKAVAAAKLGGQAAKTGAQAMIDMYSAEDNVFRLAAWLRAKEEGASDLVAGKRARRSFLDYNINAPWVAAMRNSGFPFIAYTYRAAPMLLEIMGKKPHKIMKLMALAAGLNTLGLMLSGGDGDEERKLLPEEKAGKVWGLVPKLIRMPWNDDNGSPVYLDIRRYIPLGDIVDLGQTQSAVPILPALMPSGPLVAFGELLLNKSSFTGKPIVQKTDTAAEATAAVLDHLYKAFAPNLLGLPGTHATQGVVDAVKGKTDAFGREQSVPQALLSSAGIKLGSYPKDVLENNQRAKLKGQDAEIDRKLGEFKRRFLTKRIDQAELDAETEKQQSKKSTLTDALAEKLK